MKFFYFSIILFTFIASFAIAQQKGVLQEGYHMPGAIYIQPSDSHTDKKSNQNSDIKNEYASEAASLKRKYDMCMSEHDRMPTPKDAFDFSKSLKNKECKNYYERYMELTARVIQLEQAGY